MHIHTQLEGRAKFLAPGKQEFIHIRRLGLLWARGKPRETDKIQIMFGGSANCIAIMRKTTVPYVDRFEDSS